MKKVYEALSGLELATAIAKATTTLALSIPGLNSRLTTFPMARVDITIRLRSYDRAEVVVTEMDDFIERLVAEGIESGAIPDMDLKRDEEFTLAIDESGSSADAIRRAADIATTKPVLTAEGRIIDQPDTPNPLPAGENMENIIQFGAPGMPMPGTGGAVTSGRGRVIDLSETGRLNVSEEVIRPKLKGDPNASHFRVRQPQ